MENWRELLAKDIALHNRDLSQRQLNLLVQRAIDRIVFLRIAEDRDIEAYGRLRSAAGEGKEVYEELKILFNEADDKYNSGLFHFGKEERVSDPDLDSLKIHIPDEPLRRIIKNLYFPFSPYEFSVLPADILGQVYEQFLGKVIELSAGGAVRVEEKPEVRKAGGVYYTPAYIVDYIVENTVGALLKGATPAEAEKLRILDPACGSGSFLTGAYQYLLDWHLDYYRARPKQYRNRVREIVGEGMILTTAEKRRILLDNIYGVDLDQNAVEVSKLSLLLKMLEKENDATGRQTLMFSAGGRILPDLSGNIKWGNSLIGSDFYDGKQPALFTEEERLRIKFFDWHSEDGFPAIIDAGGFDAVIGNPPYIRIQTMKETAPDTVPYYKKNYIAASKGNYDIYVLFIERGINLLNKQGKLGYIVPSKFFATDYGIALRGLLAEEQLIDHIVDFGHAQVFDNATTYTCLLFLSKTSEPTFRYLSAEPQEMTSDRQDSRIINKSTLSAKSWIFLTEDEHNFLSKLSDNAGRLLDLPADMSRGSSSGADTVMCLKYKDGKLFTRKDEPVEIEVEMLRQPIYATDFNRYSFSPNNNERIIFPYEVSSNGYSLMDEDVIKARFPKTYSYLLSNKERLLKRKQFKGWYSFSAPRNLNLHDNAQILVPLLANRGLFSLYPDQGNRYCLMASGGFSVSLSNKQDTLSTKYLLGLLNSQLLFWNLRQISNKFRGGWITCTKQYFGQLPIRTIDFDDPADVALHDQMVALVDKMLDWHKQLPDLTGEALRIAQARIERTDREIDELVYRLYGLSENEVRIVEGG
ncbi:MAG: N-6 DNA methylase [Chloroflexi bacterium]|nr:N-6 DNA methylase [Chloroflexota bacterium]